MNRCGDNSLPKSSYTMYNTKDTTIVTRIDTIPFYTPTPITVQVPVYTPIYDTLGKSFIYDNPVEDSLISGNIKTTFMDCQMIKQQLIYVPKFPKYIYRTDSVTIHDSTYVEKIIYQQPKTKIGIGFTGLISDRSTLFGNILLKTKKDDIFAIGYDPFYKSFLITYNKILTFKKIKWVK